MSKPVDSSSGTVTNYSPPQNKNKSMDFLQNIFVGSISGMSAVSIIQPMIYFKNLQQSRVAQEGKSVTVFKGFEKNPRVWYRGVGVFAASFAPTVAIQTTAKGILSKIWDPLVAASVAGMISAIAVCPAELIMIQQQNTGKNFWETAKHVGSNYGVRGFFRGLLPTGIREGVFTTAYLGATPMLKEKVRSLRVNEWVAQGIAGTIVGIVVAAISHPFDTFKTQKQGNFSMQKSMIKAIFEKAAFAGFGWRTGMVITATTLIPLVQEKLNATIERIRS